MSHMEIRIMAGARQEDSVAFRDMLATMYATFGGGQIEDDGDTRIVRLDGKYHVDHRIPLSRNGDNNPGNLCLTHPYCNQSKKDKMPWEWCGRLL